MSFLQCVGLGFAKGSGKLAAEVLLPGGGALVEFAEVVWERWNREVPADAARREELAGLAQMGEAEIAAAAQAAAAGLPDDASTRLYLTQIPAMVRRTFRRPSDPTGRTADPALRLSRAADLLALLPPGFPRFRPGDRAPGMADWVLVERLGVGGFGEVWRAENEHLPGEARALKFVTDPTAAKSLRNEAKLLARVRREGGHPGIIKLLDTSLSADPPCVAYEYVAGGELTGLLREWHSGGRAPTVQAVAEVIGRLAEITASVHRLSPPVVHRDLKPANVLLRPDGRGGYDCLIADFGIGGVAAGYEARVRTTGRVSGFSAAYSSPQQIGGGPPDPRDDVYSLGMIWLHLLTGNTTLTGIGKATKQSLTTRGLDATSLELLCDCVSHDVEDRPKDAGELFGRLPGSEPPRPCLAETQPARPQPAPQPPAPPPPRTAEPPRELTLDLGQGVTMRLVRIKAGRFVMGSPPTEPGRSADEGPQHEVEIARDFYLGVYPVTQQQYEAVAGQNPAYFCTAGDGKDKVAGLDTRDFPVECVSWSDAVAFCEQLSSKTGWEIRLPTEAEWEYACRAGTRTATAFGDRLSSRFANFDGNSPYNKAEKGPYLARTAKVGSYRPNAWGLFDMHGNVWEWCADGYNDNFYPPSLKANPPDGSGEVRAMRGGSWGLGGRYCRSAFRYRASPDFRYGNVGFRVVVAASR